MIRCASLEIKNEQLNQKNIAQFRPLQKNHTVMNVFWDFLSDLLGLDPKSPRIGSNAKLYLLRQVFSQTRKKLSLK